MTIERLTLKRHYSIYKNAEALNNKIPSSTEKIDLKRLARNVHIAFYTFLLSEKNYATRVFLGDEKLQNTLRPIFSKNEDNRIIYRSTFSSEEQAALPKYSTPSHFSHVAPPPKKPILEEVNDELLEIDDQDPVTVEQDPFLTVEVLDPRSDFEKQVAKVKHSLNQIKAVFTTPKQKELKHTIETERLDRHFTDENTAIRLLRTSFRFREIEGCQVQ